MPVLRSIRERFAGERPLADLRIGACLHVTAETACLVRALEAGGAAVSVCAANPFSTQAEVADELGVPEEEYDAGVARVAGARPAIVLDDGADLILALGDGKLRGALEETTTGLVRLRRAAPKFPVLAVNEAVAERALNDRHGTGQSALDGILRATNVLLAGHTLVVLGYGWAGKGIAQRARGAGAAVVVCEVDALRALEARMEGFEVMPALAAAERGDIFVTVTGSRNVLGAEHFERMRDGAILANAGHFDVEIDLTALRDAASGVDDVRPLVEQFTLSGGRRLFLLARGRVVNLAAAEGHPAAVMDVSFALQALCVEALAREPERFAPGVQPIPPEIDAEVARLKLASLGVEIDEVTEEQAAYGGTWRS